MGLLSFLSRKASPDQRRQDAHIITQAYHNTAARVPPVRGDLPIGGNGSKNFALFLAQSQLQVRPEGASQLRWESLPQTDEPAPAPTVPTLRRNESAERPSTAPNGRPLTAKWSSNSKTRLEKPYPGGQPPLPSSKSARQPSGAEARSRSSRLPSFIDGLDPEEARPRPRTARPQTPPAPSVNSSVSGSGYKDLLDAQSEFKALDFKSRVKATGARDYGEDVADRNIGENGHNLELPEVQAFYAHTHSADALRKSKCVSMADMSKPYRRDADPQSYVSQPALVESDIRTNTLNPANDSSSQHQRASREPQLTPHGVPTTRQDLHQRPTTSDAVSRRQSHATNDPEPGSGGGKLKVRRLAYRGGPALPLSPLRNTLDLKAENNADTSLEDRVHLQRPDDDLFLDTNAHAEPATLASQSAGTDAQDHYRKHDDFILTQPLSGHRAVPLKPSGKRKSGPPSVTSSTKPHLGHSVKPSVSSSVASYHTAIDFAAPASPLSTHRDRAARKHANRASLQISMGRVEGLITKDTDAAPSPYTRTGGARYEIGNVHANRQRTQSLTSSLRQLNTADLSEFLPPRTSSARNWSITSTTPTASDTSSNPFQRTHSPHTAKTSVDLGATFQLKNASHTSLGHAPRSPIFNIDDHISSDEDSLEPLRPRAAGEESLLFSTSGYGMGSQLPGLPDALACTPPRELAVLDDTVLSARPRSSASLPPGYLHHAFAAPDVPPTRRRYILDTAADYDDDEDEDEDDAQSWHGGDGYTVTSRVPPPTKRARGTSRLSALGSHHAHALPAQEVIEEERDMSRLDIPTAIRMRREEKARKRAATSATHRELLKRKGSGVGVDQGHYADIEC